MQTPLAVIALCACVLGLSACDKTAPHPPAPKIDQTVSTESGAAAGAGVATPVPSAESVFPPSTSTTQADAALGKTDGTRKPAQASAGALMPGQNNDHSAPLSTAK